MMKIFLILIVVVSCACAKADSNSNNKTAALFGQIGYHDIIYSTSEIDTNWNFITITRDGTTAKIYINGILDNN